MVMFSGFMLFLMSVSSMLMVVFRANLALDFGRNRRRMF